MPLRDDDDAAAGPRMDTRATRLLGIRLPIVQGGLARVAFADLAAAVSNAGGLGQISTVGLGTPERLRAEIRRCRALTDKPFGVNFPIGRFDLMPLLEVALEEGVRVVALTAGNPRPYIRRCEGTGARTLVLTAGPELARKAEAAGADLVATVGYEGGGHIGRGDETTLVMVPRVVAAVKIPVLASGGIATGAGLLAALALGAEGVRDGHPLRRHARGGGAPRLQGGARRGGAGGHGGGQAEPRHAGAGAGRPPSAAHPRGRSGRRIAGGAAAPHKRRGERAGHGGGGFGRGLCLGRSDPLGWSRRWSRRARWCGAWRPRRSRACEGSGAWFREDRRKLDLRASSAPAIRTRPHRHPTRRAEPSRQAPGACAARFPGRGGRRRAVPDRPASPAPRR